MKSKKIIETIRTAARQSLATGLALSMVLFTQMQLSAQGGYAPSGAEQLNQLVAPIALYPDALVAQVLAAATYPQQIADADNYVRQNSGMPPQQMAAAVDGLPWDPSVKALTAFPSVLDNLARNGGWTAALGNAYYNQPGDVMNAIQAMRYQAQQAGNLRSTSQLRVYNDAGQIDIAPVNPEYVYVPYYNPWAVYGAPIPAYAGYYYAPPSRGLIYAGLIGFAAVAVGVGIWGHYHWGWHAWSPNWRGGNVSYNRGAYISQSPTVYNHGHFGEYNRGVYEHGGAGVPRDFHPAAGFRGNVPANRAEGFNRPGGQAVRPVERQNGFNRPANEARPAQARPEYRAPATQARPEYRAPATQARPEYRAPAAQARPEYRAPAAQARPENRAPAAQARPQVQARPQPQARPEGRAPSPRQQESHPAPAEHHPAPAHDGHEKK